MVLLSGLSVPDRERNVMLLQCDCMQLVVVALLPHMRMRPARRA